MDKFEVTFWGTRGSSPVAMNHSHILRLLDRLIQKATHLGLKSFEELSQAAHNGKLFYPLHFGGHTPCTDVLCGEERFIIDMGSGIRDLGTKLLGKETSFKIFLTHLHWDHLLGLNFFMPIFAPGNKVTFYYVHKTAPESVKLLFNGVNFPLKWESLGSNLEFKEVKPYEVLQFSDVKVSPFSLDHPGGSFGWRFDAYGKSAAIGFDGEYKRISRKELGRDLPYYQNLDLLVFDAQYQLDELLNKHDWGHSSPSIGVDLALREGIKKLVLVHHDPWADDERLHDALIQARNYANEASKQYLDQWPDPNRQLEIIAAYDGLTVKI